MNMGVFLSLLPLVLKTERHVWLCITAWATYCFNKHITSCWKSKWWSEAPDLLILSELCRNKHKPFPAVRSILWGRPWVCRAVRSRAARYSPSAAAGRCASAHITHIPSYSSPPRCSRCLTPCWPLIWPAAANKYNYNEWHADNSARCWSNENSLNISEVWYQSTNCKCLRAY